MSNHEPMLSSDVNKNYPEPRSDYTYSVAKVGEMQYILALENLGYEVEWHHVNHNYVDIAIPKYSIGIEVWNHSEAHCYNSRMESVIENLKSFKYKYLFTSHISYSAEMTLESNGITVVTTGFQTYPNEKAYKDFYRKARGKKYFTDRTIKIIQNLVKSYIPKLPTEAYVYSYRPNTESTSLYDCLTEFSGYALAQVHAPKRHFSSVRWENMHLRLDSMDVKSEINRGEK
jgi:hypothetical protein